MTEKMEPMNEDENLSIDFEEDKSADTACSVRHTLDDVNKLPFEDTIWFIDLSMETLDDDDDDNGDDDDSLIHVLTIRDRQNVVIHKTCTDNSLNIEQCKEVLIHCMFNPPTGVARRPVKVICKHSSSSNSNLKLDLSDIGITYINEDYTKYVDHRYLQMRCCNVCRLRGTSGLFKKCGSCNAMLYCSKECQVKDWRYHGQMSHCSHKLWCTRMAMYMSNIDKLKDLPFTFTNETTLSTFTETRYIEFLKSHGIYNQGGWRTEITQQQSVTFGELTDYNDDDDIIVLPVESCILDDPIISVTDLQYSWMSYYNCRGFRMDSPIAILMQWPLTLFYIIKHCLPNDYPNWSENFDGKNLLVDIVGVEKEVDILPVFKELGYLLPDLTIDIQMYGKEISSKIDGHVYEVNNLKIKVFKGLYHKISTTARAPSVVIGFNAGLAAYKQWSQTLVKLRSQLVPAYFTDYCEYSFDCSRLSVEELGLGTVSDCCINPFRCPVRKLSAENDLPLYCNGFLYHLKYPP
ncbi:Zinc finger MYND domain-containing protein 15 [Mactra antiquata]